MFDEIRGDFRIQPRVSAVLIITTIVLTLLLFIEPRLEYTYGVHDNYGVTFLTRMTVPFCHGFNPSSAFTSLGINVVLMYFLGSFLEKILGGKRFLIATLVSYIGYVLLHRAMLLIGNGFTPIIMTYSGMIFIVLFEGRYVKTNTVFDDYYRTLWFVQAACWLLLPVLFSIIPIYFDSNYDLVEKIIYGNVTNISCGVIGILLGLIFRPHIRKKLVQRTRKKYIKHDTIDNYAWLIALGFPLFIVIKFFL
jgi:membrane associated rhomboid family serine protease